MKNKLTIIGSTEEELNELRNSMTDLTVSEVNDLELLQEIGNLVVVYSRLVSENTLMGLLENALKSAIHVVYVTEGISSRMRGEIIESKGVTVLRLDEGVGAVVNVLNMERNRKLVRDNVFAFYGSDRKTGTTMIAQTVASNINKEGLSVCYIDISGHVNNKYIQSDKEESTEELTTSVEDLRVRISNQIATSEAIKVLLRPSNGKVKVIKGFSNITTVRYFDTQTLELLVKYCKEIFDVVILDCGAPSDIAVSSGGLNCTDNRFLIVNDSMAALNNYRSFNQYVLSKIGVEEFMLVVNNTTDSTSMAIVDSLVQEYGMGEPIANIPRMLRGIEAENSNKLLQDIVTSKRYKREVSRVSDFVLEYLGIKRTEDIDRGRNIFNLGGKDNRLWKRFM